ncbi:cytochrome C oxidase subunit IV family protein [Amycolatopsis acidicola]|uniref:Cytochrome C oxidase subunit IV family protein n=1 Tax=Amycolatopsis acidicola TaxID=2596893 RepID=A0A5N0VHY9_9PSEU|nr:cytochrome C oxidase subunit IV family protein [Amycolatopsis acidicola]KAA9165969.1 cytochrome C oxidase subunit IV family protein [Amycolatopsis acidicola]
MSGDNRRRILAVWAGLMLATACGWWIGTDHPIRGTGPHWAAAAVVSIAFIKARYIGLDFMGLRQASRMLRGLFAVWTTVVGAAVTLLALV